MSLAKAVAPFMRVAFWWLVGATAFAVTYPLTLWRFDAHGAATLFAITAMRAISTIAGLSVPVLLVYVGVVSGATPRNAHKVIRLVIEYIPLHETMLIIAGSFFALSALRIFWTNGIWDGLPFLIAVVVLAIFAHRATIGVLPLMVDGKQKNLDRFNALVGGKLDLVTRLFGSMSKKPRSNPLGFFSTTIVILAIAFVVQGVALLYEVDKTELYGQVSGAIIVGVLLVYVVIVGLIRQATWVKWLENNNVGFARVAV